MPLIMGGAAAVIGVIAAIGAVFAMGGNGDHGPIPTPPATRSTAEPAAETVSSEEPPGNDDAGARSYRCRAAPG